ncbi:His Kinase A (phospho-acceptor) domain-containing protein [Spirosoma fluviale]|uniref:histidine kinase n=2 Tax=Spirosoma fluviale TaxID=1597977 RepID=A0A286GPL7_9BACT|nr:His Kinase A (phospho-acceptor) domain-containing protein [Spirosoma fluviale]
MNKVVKEVSKSLSIAEFKLSRTEKEKRTVSVLLEETIDELQRKSLVLEQANINLIQAINTVKATQEQLIHKEKLASLGELMAGIAHEIQNPLNFVNNFSEVSAELVTEIEEELQKPDRDVELETELLTDLRKNLYKINHHGGRASAIVRGMLDHSRTSTSERRLINLNALTDEYLRLAYHGLRAKDKNVNCELVTSFDTHLGEIELMPQEIGRVLLNLFNNAFYAVQEKQKTAPVDYQPTVTVSTQLLSQAVEIRVKDNGMGIPATIKDKIFQPFFTTKPTGEGTGLGLSLSYDIITKGHGGTMEVRTESGLFTEFIITLPTSPLPA